MARHISRVIVPDFHGSQIDPEARRAFLRDLKVVRPEELVFLGDGIDAGGTFNSHPRTYVNEYLDNYSDDVGAANEFLDDVFKIVPNARAYYLEGNHEQHVERFAARTFAAKKDADAMLSVFGPQAMLRLKERGIKYYLRSEQYMGVSIPGTIRLGKCFFTHGISASASATAVHLARFGATVVHGHTHRAQSIIGRTVSSSGIGAYCPGTLAKLQPLYMHTNPTTWSHGYAVQLVNTVTGLFFHMQIPIFSAGRSMLLDVVDHLAAKKKANRRKSK